MRASVSKIKGVTIVQLAGQINFETILPFRKQCIEKLWNEKVVFSFEGLSFVGSNGITSFFETIKDFIDNNKVPPKFCCVQIEFQKLFEAWFNNQIEIYDKEDVAIAAFTNPESTVGLARKLNSQNLGLPSKFEIKDPEVPAAAENLEDPLQDLD